MQVSYQLRPNEMYSLVRPKTADRFRYNYTSGDTLKSLGTDLRVVDNITHADFGAYGHMWSLTYARSKEALPSMRMIILGLNEYYTGQIMAELQGMA